MSKLVLLDAGVLGFATNPKTLVSNPVSRLVNLECSEVFMTHSNPDKVSLDQVLRLVEQLPAEEQEQLRLKLNGKAWGEEWDRLSQKIQDKFRADAVPIPTEEEIMNEVKAARNERKAKRPESGN